MKTIFAAIWFMLVLGAGAAGTLQAQVIIVNSGVKVSEISKSDLYDIFTGASTDFKDGSRAVPITLKSGPAHEAFLKEYIGKKETLFRGGWMKLVFAGQATMPQAFDSEAELIHRVASVPGAIGYVSTLPDNKGVKQLTVK